MYEKRGIILPYITETNRRLFSKSDIRKGASQYFGGATVSSYTASSSSTTKKPIIKRKKKKKAPEGGC